MLALEAIDFDLAQAFRRLSLADELYGDLLVALRQDSRFALQRALGGPELERLVEIRDHVAGRRVADLEAVLRERRARRVRRNLELHARAR